MVCIITSPSEGIPSRHWELVENSDKGFRVKKKRDEQWCNKCKNKLQCQISWRGAIWRYEATESIAIHFKTFYSQEDGDNFKRWRYLWTLQRQFAQQLTLFAQCSVKFTNTQSFLSQNRTTQNSSRPLHSCQLLPVMFNPNMFIFLLNANCLSVLRITPFMDCAYRPVF